MKLITDFLIELHNSYTVFELLLAACSILWVMLSTEYFIYLVALFMSCIILILFSSLILYLHWILILSWFNNLIFFELFCYLGSIFISPLCFKVSYNNFLNFLSWSSHKSSPSQRLLLSVRYIIALVVLFLLQLAHLEIFLVGLFILS